MDKTCVHCGNALTGRQERYCSPKCSRRAHLEARKADGRLAEQRRRHRAKRDQWNRDNSERYQEQRTCLCGAEFSALKYGSQEHCSKRCARQFDHGYCVLPQDHPAVRERVARHLAHLNEVRLAPRRKRRKVSAPRRRRIYERDGWVCWICRESVDREATPGSEWSPSLDHVIPRSHGGGDDDGNLRLAHFWCNAVRGDETYYTVSDLRQPHTQGATPKAA